MAPSPRESSQYAVVYDGLLHEDKDDEYDAWMEALLQPASIAALEKFVVGKVGGGRDPTQCRYINNARGSYNQVLQFWIDDGRAPSRLALRLPQRCFSAAALAGERVANEVAWMQYLEEQSTVPVPHIYAWGVDSDADAGADIGPYMLMDYVEGQSLYSCLLAWEVSDEDQGDRGEEEEGKEKGNDEEKEKKEKGRQANLEKRTFVFEQLAGLLLELRSHRFDKIGSIRRTGGGGSGNGGDKSKKGWAVTRRPLTFDMHEQVADMPGFMMDDWPAHDKPLLHARDYAAMATRLRNQQMLCLRNINIPGSWNKEAYLDLQEGDAIDMPRALKTARGRFLARRALALPATWAHLEDDGEDNGFALFCPDLSANNILVDPHTGRITALIDFEYTNAVPAALADDPPVWLAHLGYGFARYLDWGFVAEWQTLYQPTLDVFLEVLERVEKKEEWQQQQQRQNLPPLSVRMRASWETKRFLVHWALQRAAFADVIYHDQPALFPPVPEAVDATNDWNEEVRMYEEYTRWQIDLYEADRKGRLQKAEAGIGAGTGAGTGT